MLGPTTLATLEANPPCPTRPAVLSPIYLPPLFGHPQRRPVSLCSCHPSATPAGDPAVGAKRTAHAQQPRFRPRPSDTEPGRASLGFDVRIEPEPPFRCLCQTHHRHRESLTLRDRCRHRSRVFEADCLLPRQRGGQGIGRFFFLEIWTADRDRGYLLAPSGFHSSFHRYVQTDAAFYFLRPLWFIATDALLVQI